jgi:tRNA/tmRNA/rRNA uracil-C5-methylase (TrmA/RlmC/RlmD family)
VADESLLGTVLDLDIGGPAAGGSCVARIDDEPSGRVVFVRNALPGERVRARITEDRGGSFCRAEAVEILHASPERVVPPCPHALPGRCGGCDWQHATGDAQHEIKATVIRDQFARLAGLDLTGVFTGVAALPGGLLGWRTRMSYAVDRDGRPGLHRHGSHDLEPLERCPLGVAGVGDSPVLAQHWPGVTGVEVVAAGPGDPEPAVLEHRPGPGRQSRGRRPPDRVTLHSGPPTVHRELGGRRYAVAAGGFWQVHPHALPTFSAAMLDALQPRTGEVALDLYAGAGALSAVLADAVGPTGRVVGLESDRQAVDDAAANLAGASWAEVRRARVDGAVLAGLDVRPDLVVLDPPRAGAGREVMGALAELQPRAICYISCDPATLARDIAALAALGWRLERLQGYDAFPMTQHVECVALLQPDRREAAP